MKKYFFLFCLFIGFVFGPKVFSQEKYHFDYYTIYDYKNHELDSSKKIEMNFSNSTDSDYHLYVKFTNDSVTSSVLIDYKNRLYFTFPNFSLSDIKSGVMLNQSSSKKINYDDCINTKNNFYDISYALKNGIKTIGIKRFKNSKKKTLILELVLETEPTNITKLQHFNIAFLATPIWCQKFILNNEDVITKSYFFEKGKKKHIRDLTEIKKIDFTLNITNINNTLN